jgi:hypothetical protein
MGKRESWRSTLDSEMRRWSAMSYDELIFHLRDVKSYEVDTGQNRLQVEVEIIENTPEYVHVMIGVDDSTSLYASTDGQLYPSPGLAVARSELTVCTDPVIEPLRRCVARYPAGLHYPQLRRDKKI